MINLQIIMLVKNNTERKFFIQKNIRIFTFGILNMLERAQWDGTLFTKESKLLFTQKEILIYRV